MLRVFICEDNLKQREDLEKMVENYIFIEELDMELTLSTANPHDILDYLEENSETIGLYFLDVDLQCEMTGITLGKRIREIDVSGKIVFITTHGEMAFLTFTHQIEAMDYIIKDQNFGDILSNRVCSCIQVAHKRYLVEKSSLERFFKVKVGSKSKMIPFDDIMFFTTSGTPHKLTLHLENGQLGFMGTMKEIEDYHPNFVRVHTSYIANIANIETIDPVKREMEMK